MLLSIDAGQILPRRGRVADFQFLVELAGRRDGNQSQKYRDDQHPIHRQCLQKSIAGRVTHDPTVGGAVIQSRRGVHEDGVGVALAAFADEMVTHRLELIHGLGMSPNPFHAQFVGEPGVMHSRRVDRRLHVHVEIENVDDDAQNGVR